MVIVLQNFAEEISEMIHERYQFIDENENDGAKLYADALEPIATDMAMISDNYDENFDYVVYMSFEEFFLDSKKKKSDLNKLIKDFLKGAK